MYYLFFEDVHYDANPSWVLKAPKIYLFTLVTVLITASGYLINDYVDFDSDLANSKSSRLENKFNYLRYYFILVVIGFLISLWFAMDIGKPFLASIYLVAVGLLFMYSTTFKKHLLFGNVIVSLFSTLVLLILLYAEKEGIATLPTLIRQHLYFQTLIFCAFVFLISMVREIVKDIEDVEGDRKLGDKTLPVSYGIKKSSAVASGFGLVLIVTFLLWIIKYISLVENYVIGYGVVFLIVPTIFITYRLFKGISISESAAISRACKFIMIAGLFFMFLTQSDL